MKVTLVVVAVLVCLCNAASIFVEETGVDSETCGAQKSPCGSIFGAIAVANSGDRVLFYPGIYVMDPSASAVISQNITFEAQVPEEGPIIFKYEQCLNSNLRYALKIANDSDLVEVTFSQMGFTAMNCTSSGSEPFPPYVLIESTTTRGVPSVKVRFHEFNVEDTIFTYTTGQTGELAEGELIHASAITAIAPQGSDPIHVEFKNSLFSRNSAIAYESSGAVTTVWENVGVYQTYFYEFPPVYLLHPHNFTSIESAWNGNTAYDDPLASFIFVNASATTGSVCNIELNSFKNGRSPAMRLEGPVILNVTGSQFEYCSNTQSNNEHRPPFVGTAAVISYYQPETLTVQGSIHIMDSAFVKNGMTLVNQNEASVVGAAGFANMLISDSTFSNNSAVSVAVMEVGKTAQVSFTNCVFSGNSHSALLLSASGPENYHTTIRDCEFTNNLFTSPLNASVHLGSFVPPGLNKQNEVTFHQSTIQGSTVGVFLDQTESVEMEAVIIQSTTGVICDGGNIVASNSQLGGVTCTNGCTIEGNSGGCQ